LSIDEVDELVGPIPDWAKNMVKADIKFREMLKQGLKLPTGVASVNKLTMGDVTAESVSSQEASSTRVTTAVSAVLKFKDGQLTSWDWTKRDILIQADIAELLIQHGSQARPVPAGTRQRGRKALAAEDSGVLPTGPLALGPITPPHPAKEGV
jgi:hypothetical protein